MSGFALVHLTAAHLCYINLLNIDTCQSRFSLSYLHLLQRQFCSIFKAEIQWSNLLSLYATFSI